MFLPAMLAVILLTFSACNAKDDAAQLLNDGKKSYENISNEVKEIGTKIEEVKNKAEETAEDIKNAAKAVEDAKNSILEIGE